MKESKLIKLLRRLDKAEIKRLSDFVNSPYFNKNAKYGKIFDELIKYYPDFKEGEFSEEKVYKKSLAAKEYDYFAMKNILSDLHDLGLKFLLQEHEEITELDKEIKIVEMLRVKEVFDEYKKRLGKVKTELDKQKNDGEFYFDKKYHLLSEEISYFSIVDPNTRFDLKQEELNTLIHFFLTKIVKAYCSLLHELKQNNYPFEFTMMDNISDYLKKNSFEDIPVLNMYKNVLFLQQTGDYKYYKILQDIRDEYFYSLNKGDMYMLFVYMRSYVVVGYSRTMDRKYLRDCFELDKYMYERGRSTLGKILYPDFIATVKSAAAVGEFDWAEKYMKQMTGQLLDEAKEDALNFSYAFIEYSKGNLTKAMELLYKVNFNIFIMQIQVYILLERVYYEIGHFEDALNLAKSAKGYLNKEIALGEMKTNLKNFFNYTSRMIKLKLSVEVKEDFNFKKDKLQSDIENMKFNYFGGKAWLLEQVKLLK